MADSLTPVFQRLSRSPFRMRFRLSAREQAYLQSKGLAVILDHARGFLAKRLAPSRPNNDGRQTPMRGHPVFVAQHATATCCRGCLAKWHAIPTGRALTAAEKDYLVSLIERWLRERGAGSAAA